jgi:hypothetical protein
LIRQTRTDCTIDSIARSSDSNLTPRRVRADFFSSLLRFAEPRGMRPIIAHRHLGLGKSHKRRGCREQAREHLTIATTMYRQMDMPFYLERAEAETSSSHGDEAFAHRVYLKQ